MNRRNLHRLVEGRPAIDQKSADTDCSSHSLQPALLAVVLGLVTILTGCSTIVGNGGTPNPTPGTGSGCVGSYTMFLRVTNNTVSPASIWWRPPSGTTIGTAADVSSLPAPYSSIVEAVSSAGPNWCGPSAVTFPVNSSYRYQFTIYVKNTPPPPPDGTNTTLKLEIRWGP